MTNANDPITITLTRQKLCDVVTGLHARLVQIDHHIASIHSRACKHDRENEVAEAEDCYAAIDSYEANKRRIHRLMAEIDKAFEAQVEA